MNKINKALSPVCKILKKNSKLINLILVSLYLFMALPIDNTFNVDYQKKIFDGLNSIFDNPIIDVISLAFLFCAFTNGDAMMVALFIAVFKFRLP